MATATAPNKSDVIVINFAGTPLANWVASTKERSVNFWASEDEKWAYFERFSSIYSRDEECNKFNNFNLRKDIAYEEAGKMLAQM